MSRSISCLPLQEFRKAARNIPGYFRRYRRAWRDDIARSVPSVLIHHQTFVPAPCFNADRRVSAMRKIVLTAWIEARLDVAALRTRQRGVKIREPTCLFPCHIA